MKKARIRCGFCGREVKTFAMWDCGCREKALRPDGAQWVQKLVKCPDGAVMVAQEEQETTLAEKYADRQLFPGQSRGVCRHCGMPILRHWNLVWYHMDVSDDGDGSYVPCFKGMGIVATPDGVARVTGEKLA